MWWITTSILQIAPRSRQVESSDRYGCSTVVLLGFTCPAITVGTVILRALDRVCNGDISLDRAARPLQPGASHVPPHTRRDMGSTERAPMLIGCGLVLAIRRYNAPSMHDSSIHVFRSDSPSSPSTPRPRRPSPRTSWSVVLCFFWGVC